MRYRGSFQSVSLRELSRECSRVVDRVMRGERLIVCRHGWPVATLQPLTGFVSQPLEGREFDIHGSPLGDVAMEVHKLSQAQQALLSDGISRGRFTPGRIRECFDWAEVSKGLDDLVVRGLARRTARIGLIPTGRGIVLREYLRARSGADDPEPWFFH